MSVENLATLPENVASVLDLVVWVLEAGAGALVQAQGPVAAQVTVPAGMVLLCCHLLDHAMHRCVPENTLLVSLPLKFWLLTSGGLCD
jgi:hypothetical protein